MFIALESEENRALIESFPQFIGQDAYGDSKRESPLPPDVRRAISIMESSIKHVDSHYEIGIPFKDDNLSLPNNEPEALRHFFSSERRLLRDKTLSNRYVMGMQEGIALGHARKLSQKKIAAITPGRTWYNTHHPVINPRKPEKLRIVFNLAANFSGVSLNSKLLKGLDMLNNLVSVLMCLRTHQVAVVADI